jgi:hypothetical protein
MVTAAVQVCETVRIAVLTFSPCVQGTGSGTSYVAHGSTACATGDTVLAGFLHVPVQMPALHCYAVVSVICCNSAALRSTSTDAGYHHCRLVLAVTAVQPLSQQMAAFKRQSFVQLCSLKRDGIDHVYAWHKFK